MNIRSKEKLAGGIVYTLLTLIVLAIIALAVVSLVTSMKGEETPQIDADDLSPAENLSPYPAEEIIAEDESGEAKAAEKLETDAEEALSPSIGEASDAAGAAESVNPDADVAAESTEEAEEVISPNGVPNAIPQSIPERFVLPCKGSVSKDYADDALVYSLTMNDYRAHLGVDVSANVGAAVYACADGVISSIYDDPFMGKCVMIEHGGGLKSFYMNLSGEYPADISVGAAVTCGQVIGSVGESSLSEQADSPHLHFEMTLGGTHCNPADYVPYDSSTVMAYYEDSEPEK